MRQRTWMTAIVTFFATVAFAAASSAAMPSFAELDENKDGVLSRAEVSEVEGLDFAEADSNGDGKLDRVEYQKAIG